ncbi:carbonic anhydrase [Verrucomicrobia bacterium LW23]|nr:carbonic anhydrase [Verrucomicrobia bacterium LW23]
MRQYLTAFLATLTVAVALVMFGLVSPSIAQVSAERQQSLTPDDVLKSLKEGNERYADGKVSDQKITARRVASAPSQHPKAVILSCLDSRVPVELVFDMGIGDVFVGRVAGNVQDTDQIGSMEFATKVAGARLVMVLGHQRCGAVVGAINKVELGNLTSLLAKIRPAVEAVTGFEPDQRNSNNEAFVEAVTKQSVKLTIASIRKGSPILTELEKSGQIKIVGGIYDLKSGKVEFID